MANKELDSKIRSLNYNPKEVLAYPGSTVEEPIPAEAHFDGNTYVVETKEKHTLAHEYNPAIQNAHMDVTYPGALVFANQALVESNPHPLVAQRAPIYINANLTGLTLGSMFEVKNPTYANVNAAINKIVGQWLETYPNYNNASTQQLTLDQAVDEKQVELSFGINGRYLLNKLGIDLKASAKHQKTYFLAKFEQIFYTVSAALPSNPSDVFEQSVNWDDLCERGVDANNPPAIVQNVQYGQMLFIKLESTDSAADLGAALKGVIGVDGFRLKGNGDGKTDAILKNVSYSVLSFGGNINTLNDGKLVDGIDKLNDMIQGNTKFSKDTPGYPLYYKAAFLKDNAPAVINGATEFITSELKRTGSGTLTLIHHGAFLGRFYISWDELSYDRNGKEQYTPRSWEKNGKTYTAPHEIQIPLRGNCRNIRVKGEGNTGLVWQLWQTIVNTPAMSLVPSRTVKITGITFDMRCTIDPPVTI